MLKIPLITAFLTENYIPAIQALFGFIQINFILIQTNSDAIDYRNRARSVLPDLLLAFLRSSSDPRRAEDASIFQSQPTFSDRNSPDSSSLSSNCFPIASRTLIF